jgi:EmrB/QacA subfamily drug resistance transporter
MTAESKRARYQVTFAVLAVAVAAYSLLQSLVSPVLGLLASDLRTSQDTVTWVLTAYLLSASVFTPILGRVGDIAGKKRVLVVVLLALAVGSVLAATASSIGVMIVARAIQGVGGGVIPLAFSIIRDEFPPEKVGGAVGVIAALLAVGGGLGTVLAGPIVNALDYHWLFWIPGGAVVLAAVATHFVIPESSVRGTGRINWGAAVLLSGWLVALLVAISEAPIWGWGSARVIGLIVAAVVLAAGWVAVELRSAHPLIDMRMMRITAVWTTNLVALLFGAGLYAVFAFLPQFVQTPSLAGYGFGASITRSGLIMLPMAVAMFIFGVLSGPLAARIGAKAVVVGGSAVSIAPFAILAFAHGRLWEIEIAMLLIGVGFGLVFSAMSNIIVDAVPPGQTGVASGMNANIRTIGGALGSSLMASVVTAGIRPDGLPRESGYASGFAMLAAAAILATLAGLLIPTLRRGRSLDQYERVGMLGEEAAMVAGAAVPEDDLLDTAGHDLLSIAGDELPEQNPPSRRQRQ